MAENEEELKMGMGGLPEGVDLGSALVALRKHDEEVFKKMAEQGKKKDRMQIVDQGGPQVDSEGKNAKKIMCPWCPTVILLPGAAKLVKKDIFLCAPSSKDPSVGEILSEHYLVTSQMDFENIGVTKPIAGDAINGRNKYLSCATCDLGPVGISFASDQFKTFYVTHKRVNYI